MVTDGQVEDAKLGNVVGDTFTCDHCGKDGPCAMMQIAFHTSHAFGLLALCPECLATIIELVTGWKMVNIVKQFRLNSAQGEFLRANKVRRPVGRPRRER